MKPIKNISKTVIPRIFYIDQEISAGKYPNVPTLAKKYETSQSSINRDIAYMRDMLGAPIEYDHFKKGFFYSKKTFRLPSAYATSEDILALGMVKNLIDLYRDTPVHNNVSNLLESISEPLKGESIEWLHERFVIPKIKSVSVDSVIWQCIVSGLHENRIITFDYYEIITGKKEAKRVHCYQLIFNRVKWLLFGYDENLKKKRIFSLDNISNAYLTNDLFKIKGSCNYLNAEEVSYFTEININSLESVQRQKLSSREKQLYAIHYPRTMSDPIISAEHYFVIEFTGEAQLLEKYPLTEDQEIIKTKKGFKVSFTSNQFDKVLVFLLSQLPNAKPIAPKILIDKWKAAIRKAAKAVK